MLLEPYLEGQGGFEKVEELGRAFQDMIGFGGFSEYDIYIGQ